MGRRQDLAIMSHGIAKRALNYDQYCGDQCAIWKNCATTTICIVDGLGHGEPAELAALAAVNYVSNHLHEPLEAIFEGCNRAIASTRGAAMGIALVNHETGYVGHAGVGNTRARVFSPDGTSKNLASSNGIVGAGYRHLQLDTYSLAHNALVLLWTDGVSERLELRDYESAILTDPQSLADRILYDHGKEHDDVGIIVFRNDGQ